MVFMGFSTNLIHYQSIIIIHYLDIESICMCIYIYICVTSLTHLLDYALLIFAESSAI